jgi:hypothetical protein
MLRGARLAQYFDWSSSDSTIELRRRLLFVNISEAFLGVKFNEEVRGKGSDVESREVERSGGQWKWCIEG